MEMPPRIRKQLLHCVLLMLELHFCHLLDVRRIFNNGSTQQEQKLCGDKPLTAMAGSLIFLGLSQFIHPSVTLMRREFLHNFPQLPTLTQR